MNTSGEKSGEKQETIINETETHDHNSQTEPMVLNNGKKWKVDDHMMVFFQDMEQDIKSFSLDDLKDYQLLADGLQKNINHLTTNCTMSGMAHDELHKWLIPYITEVNALSEAENEIEAIKTFKNIQESFKTFNKYFQ
jgi:hypothetical protein